MNAWTEVSYDPEKHAGFVVDSCLKQWAQSPYRRGYRASDAAFRDEHRPVVEKLLEHERPRVFLDTEDPRVIWGWMLTSPDKSVVHEVVLKRSLYDTADNDVREFARSIIRSALGERLPIPTGHIGSMHVLRKLEMYPLHWFYDTYYFYKRFGCKTK